ncbi:MAG: class I SAM-dependent methyltransferase [Candidatus Thorarchaeota archaeon]
MESRDKKSSQKGKEGIYGERHSERPISSHMYDDEYFLTECAGYELFNHGEVKGILQRFSIALDAVGNIRGKYVLDLGCGRGEMTAVLAEKGAYVIGLDYSESALELAKKTCKTFKQALIQASLLRANATEIPIADGALTAVFLLDVIEHLTDWELRTVLKSVYDSLMPGGRVVIHTAPNKLRWTVLYTIARFLARVIKAKTLPRNGRSKTDQIVHINEQTPFSLWRNLRRAGFQVRLWTDEPVGQGASLVGFAALSRLLKLQPLRFIFGFRIWAVGWKSRNRENR